MRKLYFVDNSTWSKESRDVRWNRIYATREFIHRYLNWDTSVFYGTLCSIALAIAMGIGFAWYSPNAVLKAFCLVVTLVTVWVFVSLAKSVSAKINRRISMRKQMQSEWAADNYIRIPDVVLLALDEYYRDMNPADFTKSQHYDGARDGTHPEYRNWVEMFALDFQEYLLTVQAVANRIDMADPVIRKMSYTQFYMMSVPTFNRISLQHAQLIHRAKFDGKKLERQKVIDENKVMEMLSLDSRKLVKHTTRLANQLDKRV